MQSDLTRDTPAQCQNSPSNSSGSVTRAQVTVLHEPAYSHVGAFGYVKCMTPNPAKSVAVNATFLQLVPGRPLFMAGVPLSSVLHKTAFMPYLSGAGFTPTLALVSLQSQDVTLIARTGFDGAELCRATMNFGAGHHRSFLLRDVLSCPLRIDMLSDSTRDRCPSEASAHWRSTLGSSETIRSDNRSALTSSNSEWFRRKCPPADVRRLHREHQSLENQAVIGV